MPVFKFIVFIRFALEFGVANISGPSGTPKENGFDYFEIGVFCAIGRYDNLIGTSSTSIRGGWFGDSFLAVCLSERPFPFTCLRAVYVPR